MIQTADVVIIGGGCMGASLAYYLAKRKVKVVLLEKKHLASGPTGKSSAIIRQHYSLEFMVKSSQKALEVFSNFDEMVGGSSGFVRTGYIQLFGEVDKTALEFNVEMQKRNGVNVTKISPSDLKHIIPHINPEGVVTVAYHPDSGYADPLATTASFGVRAKELGAEILEDTQVIGIDASGGKIREVTTDKGVISTSVAVNCAGAWGQKISQLVGIDIPLRTTRPQVGFIQRPLEFTGLHPICIDFVTGSYCRPDSTKLTLIGSVDLGSDEDADPDAYNEVAADPYVKQLTNKLKTRFPIAARGSSRGGYAAIYDVTPDEQPILGLIPQLEGFYFNLGWSGHGFKHCPTIGQLMADLITEGSCEIDLSPFRLSRFEEGKLIRSDHEYVGGSA